MLENIFIFNSFFIVIISVIGEGLYKNGREEIKLFLFDDYIVIIIKVSFREKRICNYYKE